MKSTYGKILEEFLLQAKDKDQIRNFFKGAPEPAKTGYLKAHYRNTVSIVKGYYVETNSHGIEISRDESEKYSWQQIAGTIDSMISQGKYGRQEPYRTESYSQISIIELLGGTVNE